MDKNPLIGVMPLWDEEKNSLWMLPGYHKGILAENGVPATLPLTTDKAVIEQCADTFDGFLFTGGHDVSPSVYGENKLPECGAVCDERDEMETLLFNAAVLERNKPAFGICRGIQFFNALLGGTLYHDLPTQKQANHAMKPPYNTPLHTVDILPDTPLFELIKRNKIDVNSYHHQAVKILSPKLSPMAVSDDGFIEAVYFPDKAFVWAVQWHPEFWLENTVSKKLFEAFLKACQGN
jgi:putative glutamine amidotransferase